MHKPKYHVFVCSSVRLNGSQKGFCHAKEAVSAIGRLMECIEENELQDQVMVTHTGCFGICRKGPVAVVYPDNVWYGDLAPDDMEALVERHFLKGEPVSEKRIDL